MSATPRHFLALDDLSAPDLLTLLEDAQQMAAHWQARRLPPVLAGRRIALVVNDSGWRNTTAFDLGIQALGGLCVHAPLRWDTREALPDLADYLGNWVDGVVTRAPDLALLRSLAALSHGPVINARTHRNHPCETLGDLAYVWQQRGRIDGLKVAVVSPTSNILGSWVEAAAVLPITVTQVYPQGWHDTEAAASVARFRATDDLTALEDADVIVTDCWPAEIDAQTVLPYQITAALLDRLAPGAMFLPCPPVARGKEVSADAMDHARCQVIAAKAFLLHAQNAVLAWAFAHG